MVSVGLLESTVDLLARPLVSAILHDHPGIELRVLTAYSGHLQRWLDLIGARPAVRRGRAVPPPADLGAQDAKTVEGARKFLA